MRQNFLDGIRGWAALIVVLHHLVSLFLNQVPYVDYPGLRMLRDGTMAVFLFFVISGFALSIGYIAKGRRRIVVDMALRRYPRLMIPIAGGSLFAFVLMRLGLMHGADVGALLHNAWLPLHFEFNPKFTSLIRFVLYNVFFNYVGTRSYDTPLWTMNYEFAGSFLVFGILLLLKHPAPRLAACSGIAIYCWIVSSYMLPFMIGVGLADIFVWIRASRLRDGWPAALGACLAIFSAYYYVYDIRPTPPGVRTYSTIGLVTIGSIMASSRLCRLFEMRLSAWLGKVSFSLYLTHMPLVTSLACILFLNRLAAGASMPHAMTISFLVTFPVMLVAAQLFFPLENLGIRVSHAVSRRVLHGGDTAVASVRRRRAVRSVQS